MVADPVSKAHVFNRFLSPENSISVYFSIAVFSLKILAQLVNNQDVHKVIPVYLAGSRYLLLISTGSTFMKIEGKCFSSLSTFTLGGSNCARPPWLVLGRLCPLLLLTTYHIYITLTTNPHENVILGYNDIMFKTKSILRELSRPFRLPHSVVLAVEETVDV